jgi:sugar (pentulose or hexulose) kinase
MVINDAGCVVEQKRAANQSVIYLDRRVEINPAVFKEIIEGMIRSFEGDRDPLKAVSFSCLGTAMIAVDENYQPIYNGISSLDQRSLAYVDWYSSKSMTPLDVYKLTGQPPHIVSFLTNYLWLCDHEPEIVKRTHQFLSLKDYIIHELCGEAVTDPSWASRTMLMDISEGGWSAKILKAIELDEDKLPRILESTSVLNISAQASARLGIDRNAKVLPGGLDCVCTFEGIDSAAGHSLIDIVGTYEEMMDYSGSVAPDAFALEEEVFHHPGIVKDRFVYYQRVEIGYILKEFFRLFFSTDIQHELMDKINPEAGPLCLLPDVDLLCRIRNGENVDQGTHVIKADSDRTDLLKAILEGAHYKMKRVLELQEGRTSKVDRIYVIGGGASSENVLQMKADILGKELHITQHSDCSLIGSLVIALMGVNNYSLDEAKKVLKNKTVKIVRPDKKRSAGYRKAYRNFCSLYFDRE